ncbi:MAG: DUF401 family protein [Spirochaetales bacterium]|nr:DUF401 family protein [Spirochaetales bacterium]
MDYFINAGVIAAMVILTILFLKQGWNTGLLMLLNAVLACILARVEPLAALGYAAGGIFSVSTLRIVAILYFIMVIEKIMRKSGMIRGMADSLKKLVRNNRLAAGLMPMVIGMLPSPGGARFSCPLVDEVTQASKNQPVDRAYVNYWFRHVWHDGFLLYPGIILASTLLQMPLAVFFLHLLPFMLFSFLIGSLLGLSRLKHEPIDSGLSWFESLKGFLVAMAPVLYVIGMYIILSFIPVISTFALETAVISVIPVLFIRTRQTRKDFIDLFIKSFPVKLTVIILGVMVFKEVLIQSGIMNSIIGLMENLHVPSRVVFFILPLAAALLSGLAVSYVSVSFPVLISLGLAVSNPWVIIATFMAGFIGVMSTPLHLCAVATAYYFNAPVGRVLSRIILSELIMVVPVALILWLV